MLHHFSDLVGATIEVSDLVNYNFHFNCNLVGTTELFSVHILIPYNAIFL